jgi:hypothetical protein
MGRECQRKKKIEQKWTEDTAKSNNSNNNNNNNT